MAKDQSRKQVATYNFYKNKWAIAALVVFMLDVACVLLFGVIDSLIVLALMGALSIACLFCSFQITQSSKTEELIVFDNPTPIPTESIEQGLNDGMQLYGRDGKAEDGNVNCYAMSAKVNHMFVRFPIWAKVSEKDYELPESVLPYVAYLKDYRNASLADSIALRPDKGVAGLASDITAKMFESEHPFVNVNIVSRYSVQVTDDAFDKLIMNKKKISNKIVFDGRKLGLDESGALKGFAESGCASEMDIHSLLISSDGYMMLAVGTDSHPIAPKQLISSASCSLLPAEIESRPIQESMISSIHSKLRVSYNIPEETTLASSFCGFARMLPRGGAPEFYCLTRIGMTKDEIIAALKDETMCFDNRFLRPVVPELAGDAAQQEIQEAIIYVADVAGDDVSLSAAALMRAVADAMIDTPTARKILRRLGIIENEEQQRRIV